MMDPAKPIQSVDELLDYYLALGCPCRFPRFRKIIELRLPYGFASGDMEELLLSMDEKVPILDKHDDRVTWTGRCAKCGSEVMHRSAPVFRDSWVETGKIEKAPEVEDLGAAADGPIPLREPLYPAVPDVRKSEIEEVNLRYHRLPEADWFAYLSALAKPKSDTCR